MVKYLPDRTGRFSQRPHYVPKDLDRECENIIAGFLKERHGAAKYPVSTDDLTVLIERDTESLDQFAALSGYGRNDEGAPVLRSSTSFRRPPEIDDPPMLNSGVAFRSRPSYAIEQIG